MIGEFLRRRMFWLADAATGGQVEDYLSDLEKQFSENAPSSPERLNALLSHAVRTTDFYKPFEAYRDLLDFPVIRKSTIRTNYDRFLSSAYANKPLHQVRTSGSTGERFIMLQDRQKRKRVIAEQLYYYKQCGFILGQRYVHVRAWNRYNRKERIRQLAYNLVMYDCSLLSNETMNRLYKLLKKDLSIRCLTGYANSLSAIAFYFDRQGYTPDHFHIRTVSCGGERLDPRAKILLKKVFGCPVVSRYAINENGFLAQQPVDGDDFILNNAHYFFETLRLDADEPASDGEPARMVLTDLYNYAMPLIRYDTGDIVIVGTATNGTPGQRVLKDISGRREDILFDTSGNMLNPALIAVQFHQYDRLPRFQFIQEERRRYTLILEAARGMYKDEDFRQVLLDIVGRDAEIEIEHVDKIAHLSSGKFRTIICRYRNILDGLTDEKEQKQGGN